MNDKYHFNKIVIVGAGGVGFNLATVLSRDLKDFPIDVWDDDTFEGGHGAARLPAVYDKSQMKVVFLQGFIEIIMGDKGPAIYPHKLTQDSVRGASLDRTLVLDCTDMDLEPRKLLWKHLREAGATLLRVSYDGIGIVVVSPGLPFVGTKGGGYGRIPTMGQSYAAAGIGAMAVMKALKTGALSELQVTIQDSPKEG